MLVRAKTRDIAILRTMGASRRSLMKIFMTVGVSIGLIGIVIGAILGAIFLFFRQRRGERHPAGDRARICGTRRSAS